MHVHDQEILTPCHVHIARIGCIRTPHGGVQFSELHLCYLLPRKLHEHAISFLLHRLKCGFLLTTSKHRAAHQHTHSFQPGRAHVTTAHPQNPSSRSTMISVCNLTMLVLYCTQRAWPQQYDSQSQMACSPSTCNSMVSFIPDHVSGARYQRYASTLSRYTCMYQLTMHSPQGLFSPSIGTSQESTR